MGKVPKSQVAEFDPISTGNPGGHKIKRQKNTSYANVKGHGKGNGGSRKQ